MTEAEAMVGLREFDEGRFVIGVDEPEGIDSDPSIIRNERGMVRSDMIHRTMFMLSGKSEMKSQNVSCARGVLRVAAVGLHPDRMDDTKGHSG
jgi:hypothetical protein